MKQKQNWCSCIMQWQVVAILVAMPYYAEQEHDSCGLIKVRDEMEQHNTANLMEFQVNEDPESEQMMGYEDTSEYENIDTMGIETEIVASFQEAFERRNTTEFPLSESSASEEIITFENNAENGAMVPISADHELVDPYQEKICPCKWSSRFFNGVSLK